MISITILMELKDVKFAIDVKCQNIWYTCMCMFILDIHIRIMFNFKKLWYKEVSSGEIL